MVTGPVGEVIAVIYAILATAWTVWVWSSATLLVCRTAGWPRPAVANLLWYWSKPLAFVYLWTNLPFEYLTKGDLRWFDTMWAVLNILVWRYYRNIGDDDDHKKLKKKLKETVQNINGKLVVVPRPV